MKQDIFFLLMCPSCGNRMKYHTDSRILSDKKKRCVYCGKSFKAKDNILKETTQR